MMLINTPAATQGRLPQLDGLRCLAVASVILYHYLYRWAPPEATESFYPYRVADFLKTLCAYGEQGVQLFFLISGFVIFLTLSRCSNAVEFAARRYSRLAPALVLSSITTFLVLKLIPDSPFQTHWSAFVPTLLFLDPNDLNKVLHTSVFESMDGAYWSLYVEVKFYLVAGILYFVCRTAFSWGLCATAVAASLLHFLHVPGLSGISDTLLVPMYLPWFLMGAAFYAWYAQLGGNTWRWMLGSGLLLAAFNSLMGTHQPGLLSVLIIPLIFWLPLRWQALGRMLSGRHMAAIGMASYSLYLLHQHIGIALLHASIRVAGGSQLAGVLALVALVAGTVLVACASFKWVETPLSRRILHSLR